MKRTREIIFAFLSACILSPFVYGCVTARAESHSIAAEKSQPSPSKTK
jgi:hypothetical protein